MTVGWRRSLVGWRPSLVAASSSSFGKAMLQCRFGHSVKIPSSGPSDIDDALPQSVAPHGWNGAWAAWGRLVPSRPFCAKCASVEGATRQDTLHPPQRR